MQTFARQPRGRQSVASVLSTDSSTVVATSDVVQRYERILAQLSQQAVEQQAEIVALRAALQAQSADAPTQGSHNSLNEHVMDDRHTRSVRRTSHRVRHASRGLQKHDEHRQHHHHRRLHNNEKKIRSLDCDGAVQRETGAASVPVSLSPPTSPHISSIAIPEEDDISSLHTPEKLRADISESLSAGGTATPPDHAVEAPQATSSSSFLCAQGEQAQLVPASVTPPRPSVHLQEKIKAEERKTEKTSSVEVSGFSDGLSPTPPRHANTSLRSECRGARYDQHFSSPCVAVTPEALMMIDGQQPMDYLLNVFSSSIEKQTNHLEPPRSAGPASAAVVRQLFQRSVFNDKSDAEEHDKTPHTSGGLRTPGLIAIHNARLAPAQSEGAQGDESVHDTHATNLRNLSEAPFQQTWQQRYARIVAADAQTEALIDNSRTQNRSVSFSPDQSASELVDELIHFFSV